MGSLLKAIEAHLCAGGQVVVHGKRYFGLLPTDHAVRQSEIHEEGLKRPQLHPWRQAQPLLLRQANGLGHPGGDGIGDVQSQLGFSCVIASMAEWQGR